jgi:arylsulfatase A-like enzyme
MIQAHKHSLLKTYSLAFMAGSLGGLLAAVIEVLLISRFGGTRANFSALLFGIVAYGLLGGAIGKGMYFLLSFLPFHQEKRRDHKLLSGLLLAASCAGILFLVFVFRAFRDYHAEKVSPTQPLGLLTIVVVLVGAVLVFFLIQWLCRRPLSALHAFMVRPVGYFIVLFTALGLGLILQQFYTQETESVHVPFTTSQAQMADKPNVLFIMIDALRADRLGCYGSTNPATPNIDALARDGVLFRQSYSQTNNTKPSTASLLTSRYPTEHQALHKTNVLSDNLTTIAEVFEKGGYYCGGIVTNVNLAPVYNFQQGFHEYTYLPPKFLFGANEAASRLVVYGVLRMIKMRLNKSIWVQHFYRSGETVTGYFEDFLQRSKDKKFFLFLHYMDPHDPYFEHPYNGKGYARVMQEHPPSRLSEPFTRNYAQEVEYTDQWIGRVVANLKSAGLYESTLIVLTSDHGEEFYDHEGWWHGTTLQEEQLRVPLMIKLAGLNNAGVVNDSLVCGIDVTPTILNQVDLPIPPQMRGTVLFDSLGNLVLKSEVHCEADFEGNVAQALRLGSWKYIQTNPDNPRHRPVDQLFNLADDPKEQRNLVESQPEIVRDMKAQLEVRRAELLSTREKGAEKAVDQATQDRLRALGYTQ